MCTRKDCKYSHEIARDINEFLCIPVPGGKSNIGSGSETEQVRKPWRPNSKAKAKPKSKALALAQLYGKPTCCSKGTQCPAWKDKGKKGKGKKGGMSEEKKAAKDGAMVESTGTSLLGSCRQSGKVGRPFTACKL